MKKYTVIAFLLGFSLFVFAADYVPSVPSFVTPRLSAIGGYHTTDTQDYFTIFANPAGIPAAVSTGKHALFPGLMINAGGPISDVIKLLGNTSNLQNNLLELINKNNGVNAGFELIGPLTFGSLGKNFGWGFYNKISLKTVIPSITNMTGIGGADFMLRFAYGMPVINTENHFLSVGIAAKGFAKAEGLYNGSPLAIISNPSAVVDMIPLYAAFGFGFDAGVYYKLFNIFSAGITYNDFYSPMWIQQYTAKTAASSLFKVPSRYAVAPGQLNVGVGVKIPVGSADKLITAFNIMVDYKDILAQFGKNKFSARNPILDLSAGMELVLLKFLALRVGVSDMYLNAGVGLKLGAFRLDASVYGKELGLEPGSMPQLNMGLALAFYY